MLVGSVDVALVSSTTSPDNRLARASLKSKPMLNSFCLNRKIVKIFFFNNFFFSEPTQRGKIDYYLRCIKQVLSCLCSEYLKSFICSNVVNDMKWNGIVVAATVSQQKATVRFEFKTTHTKGTH